MLQLFQQLLFIAASLLLFDPVNENHEKGSNNKRLSYDIRPVNYNLKFFFDPRKDDFHGELLLDIKVLRTTRSLKLNTNGVNLSHIECGNLTGTPTYDYTNQTVKIHFNSLLYPGNHTVKLNFKGQYAEDNLGIYKIENELENGTSHTVLATQLQSIYARKVFPCFDEPDRKATFEITLVIPSEYVGLSNMPVISRKTISTDSSLKHFNSSESYTELKFAQTPVMSTYTLAMAVGKFEYIERIYKQKIPIRIYSPIGRKIYGEFALNYTVQLLDFYTDLFGIEYPLPKLDFISLPIGSSMENWGFVYMAENAISLPSEFSVENMQYVSETIAHELAHMWFGNLVTMKWWTDLWLNEGFGTWVAYYANDRFHPQYNLSALNKLKTKRDLFISDSSERTSPILGNVEATDNIDLLFSHINYIKSATILNMLISYTGEEVFFSSVRSYLKEHQYSNTDTTILWDIFSKVTGQNVASLMWSWTNLAGFPLVHVRKVGDQLIFNQTRFLLHNSTQKAERSNWIIPLKIANTKNGSVIANTIMPNDGKDFVLNCTESNIIVNPNRTAFIRVKYDKTLLDNLVQAIKEDRLSESGEHAVIDDLFIFGLNGHGDLTAAIDILKQIKDNIKGLALSQASDHLEKIGNILEELTFEMDEEGRRKIAKNFNDLTVSILSPMYEKLGWNFSTKVNGMVYILRPKIIKSLGLSGHKEVIDKAAVIFDRHFKARMKLHEKTSNSTADLINPNMHEAIYKIVNQNFGHEAFMKLVKLHNTTKNAEEKIILEMSLAHTRNEQDMEYLSKLMFTGTFGIDNRYMLLLALANSNKVARKYLWEQMVRMNTTLVNGIGGPLVFQYFLPEMFKNYFGKDFLQEATSFFSQKHFSPYSDVIKNALSFVTLNNLLLSLVREPLIKYFS